MITYKAIVIPNNRRGDGTYPVKIRVTYKRVSRRLPTTLVCSPKDLTRSLKIKNEDIISKSNELILKMRNALKDISFVIPAGTAVQNARVPLGDTLIGDDNVHLNALGDYVAGLTWFAKLTGMSIDNITYTPNTDIANKLDTIKKAVKDAIANPYTVTK